MNIANANFTELIFNFRHMFVFKPSPTVIIREFQINIYQVIVSPYGGSQSLTYIYMCAYSPRTLASIILNISKLHCNSLDLNDIENQFFTIRSDIGIGRIRQSNASFGVRKPNSLKQYCHPSFLRSRRSAFIHDNVCHK